MPTFTYIPDFSARRETRPRVRSVRFGDGYEQRSIDGINSQPFTWSLTFNNRSDSEANAIESFLQAQAGIASFDWTPPSGDDAKWICRGWERTMVRFDLNTITAKFEQVFEP
jgi:phage-related protein